MILPAYQKRIPGSSLDAGNRLLESGRARGHRNLGATVDSSGGCRKAPSPLARQRERCHQPSMQAQRCHLRRLDGATNLVHSVCGFHGCCGLVCAIPRRLFSCCGRTRVLWAQKARLGHRYLSRRSDPLRFVVFWRTRLHWPRLAPQSFEIRLISQICLYLSQTRCHHQSQSPRQNQRGHCDGSQMLMVMGQWTLSQDRRESVCFLLSSGHTRSRALPYQQAWSTPASCISLKFGAGIAGCKFGDSCADLLGACWAC